MSRRLNFTGRKKINRGDVTVRLLRNGDHLSFDADLTGLGRLKLDQVDPPPKVYVEAYRGASALWKRFDFGRVNTIRPPEDRSLDEFGDEHGIKFRIKISAVGGESHARLLAEADNLPPLKPGESEQKQRSLIDPAPSDDLGDELWRLDFSDGEPQLLINTSVPGGWKEFALDPRSRSVFAPAVMRQVLTRMLVIDRDTGDPDDPDDWRTKWCEFATRLLGSETGRILSPQVTEGGRLENLTELLESIDDAVAAFASRATLLNQFCGTFEDEGGR